MLAKGAVWPGLAAVYSYAWFVGFGVSGSVYWLLMRGQTASCPAATAKASVAATPSTTSSLA